MGALWRVCRGFPVLAAVVLVAGCGGGHRLDQTTYVKRADAVCRDFARRRSALQAPPSVAQIPAYVGKALPILESELSRLRRLRPPSALEDEVRAWLDAGDEEAALLRDLRRAAERDDAEEVRRLGARGDAIETRRRTLARQIGLTDCANA